MQAIVVIGGGLRVYAPEFGGCTLSALSLERVRYAAWLQRRTGLPLAVSGGPVQGAPVSEAALMAAALSEEQSVPVTWREAESLDTAANARRCWQLLAPLGIRRIALVTHDWHMRRAAAVFTRAGFTVLPAPTGFYASPAQQTRSRPWRPDPVALQRTGLWLYEIVGWCWYRWRGVV